DPHHTLAGSIDLVRHGYDKNSSAALLDPLLDSLSAQPGVRYAALGGLPLQSGVRTVVTMEGSQSSSNEKAFVELMRVSPGYFRTVGIPLLAGRDFTRSDGKGTYGVAIISAAMSREYWPNQNPISRHIMNLGPNDVSVEIIGVVGDTASRD